MKTDWEAAHSDGTGQLGRAEEPITRLVSVELDFDPEHVRRCYVQALCSLKNNQRPPDDSNILQEMLTMSHRGKVIELKRKFGF